MTAKIAPSAWEDWCVDTFLLAPASATGAITSIAISDVDLLAFVGTDDIEVAAAAFVDSLGSRHAVTALLSGARAPFRRNGRPENIRLLLFTCWSQTTSLRQAGEHDFRRQLGTRLGYECPGVLTGLARMFERLQAWLKTCDIDLHLWDGGHSQVGYATNVTFPTWRDRRALESVRDGMPLDRIEQPRSVAAAILWSRRAQKTDGAFAALSEQWASAIKRGDPGADRHAFAVAWRGVVAAILPSSTLLIEEDDLGTLTMHVVSEGGASAPIGTLDATSIATLRADIRKTASNGVAFLQTRGLGRWTSASDKQADWVLVSNARLQRWGDKVPDVERRHVGRSGWQLMPRRKNAPDQDNAEGDDIVIEQGIRSGSALLGRWPMTPSALVRADSAMITVDGVDVGATRHEDRLRFPPGAWQGQAEIHTSDGRSRRINLVRDAFEHHADDLKTFSEEVSIAEDGPIAETEPGPASRALDRYEGLRTEASPESLALEEALYARAARGLGVGDAMKIIERAAVPTERGLTPWDVLRVYVDAGHLEPAARRHASARVLHPRAPRLVPVYDGPRTTLVLEGLSATTLRDRVAACAKAEGLHPALDWGIGPWSPPTLSIACEDERRLRAFAHRTGLPLAPGSVRSSPANTWPVDADGESYQVAATWSRRNQRFEGGTSLRTGPRLERLEKPEINRPPLFRVVTPRGTEYFLSAVLALMRLEAWGPEPRPFLRSNNLLVRRSGRSALPAAWARSCRRTTMCSSGPIDAGERWTYAYPAGKRMIADIQRLCPIVDAYDALVPWQRRLVSSQRRDVAIYTAAGLLIDARRRGPS